MRFLVMVVIIGNAFLVSQLLAQQPLQVEGIGSNCSEALEDGMNRAVEEGGWNTLYPQTPTKYASMVKAALLSHKKHYLTIQAKHFQTQGQDKHVTLQVLVKPTAIYLDWHQIVSAIKSQGLPRVTVVIQERLDGADSQTHFSERALAKLLHQSGLPYSPAFMAPGYSEVRSQTQLQKQTSYWQNFARQQGSDFVLYGTAIAHLQREFATAEGFQKVYQVKYELQIVSLTTRTSTTLRGECTYRAQPRQAFRASAAQSLQQAMQHLYRQHYLAGHIIYQWAHSAQYQPWMTLVIKGVSIAQRKAVLQMLRQQNRTAMLQFNQYEPPTLQVQLRTKLNYAQLAQELAKGHIAIDSIDVVRNTLHATYRPH